MTNLINALNLEKSLSSLDVISKALLEVINFLLIIYLTVERFSGIIS